MQFSKNRADSVDELMARAVLIGQVFRAADWSVILHSDWRKAN